MDSDLFEHVCVHLCLDGIVDSRCFGLCESSRAAAFPYLYLHTMCTLVLVHSSMWFTSVLCPCLRALVSNVYIFVSFFVCASIPVSWPPRPFSERSFQLPSSLRRAVILSRAVVCHSKLVCYEPCHDRCRATTFEIGLSSRDRRRLDRNLFVCFDDPVWCESILFCPVSRNAYSVIHRPRHRTSHI